MPSILGGTGGVGSGTKDSAASPQDLEGALKVSKIPKRLTFLEKLILESYGTGPLEAGGWGLHSPPIIY